jgi:hypothetical protein
VNFLGKSGTIYQAVIEIAGILFVDVLGNSGIIYPAVIENAGTISVNVLGNSGLIYPVVLENAGVVPTAVLGNFGTLYPAVIENAGIISVDVLGNSGIVYQAVLENAGVTHHSRPGSFPSNAAVRSRDTVLKCTIHTDVTFSITELCGSRHIRRHMEARHLLSRTVHRAVAEFWNSWTI